MRATAGGAPEDKIPDQHRRLKGREWRWKGRNGDHARRNARAELGRRLANHRQGSTCHPVPVALYPSFSCLRGVECTDSRGEVAFYGDLNTEHAAVTRLSYR